MQYIDTWLKKLYNLINICIFNFLANIIHSLHSGEGNMNPEGNMIVLEVIIFISPKHSCNKLYTETIAMLTCTNND